MNNVEIIVVALRMMGGATQAIETEDVAVKANSLAPGRFAWRKYKDQINLDAVRKRLWDAKSQFGYVAGSESDGWMLTPLGNSFAESRATSVTGGELSREPANENEKRWRTRERDRLITCDAFDKYRRGSGETISRSEAEGFFRVDEYVIGELRDRKISRLLNAFRDDPEVSSAMSFMLTIISNRKTDGK